MSYATADDCRRISVGLEPAVIPDTSSAGLEFASCLAETDAEIDEAARGGNYEAPFGPVPERIRWLAAVGTVAKARRALELGSQEEEGPVTAAYLDQYRQGLDLLRRGRMDLGTVSVASQGLTLPPDYEQWASLGHGGIVLGSVQLACGGSEYREDRSDYDPQDPTGTKDYLVDHRLGRLRRLAGGRAGAGAECTVAYEYFDKQPTGLQEPDYTGTGAQMGVLGRHDY